MEQARGAILQCPQASGRKVYPWTGVHAQTGARLHLAERTDRKPMVFLMESGKQLLCATVERYGAIEE
jgi:hypothetical protein